MFTFEILFGIERTEEKEIFNIKKNRMTVTYISVCASCIFVALKTTALPSSKD
jgi:hypothetical protein